ncbi:pentapeptide repeat-containing protein [Campylobacter sp. VBCF_05 NA6]|uniref:pentapeptide repeat-containing protein n=1 Tax=unclassified Campylobacter TaxID=2593542 RepID=UPI0022E9E84F|nr:MULTISPECIES: pentapeptide repeat-containing protein [unclassified Campylobacter]MDA3056996.1 pentapeptide repeat-containing protein [Campylobacter sp. VBCF_04 NA7]MDA3059569.1 pentapeptide repeat-containing protein [Campylobacter sp. VBCF_05 NA6]
MEDLDLKNLINSIKKIIGNINDFTIEINTPERVSNAIFIEAIHQKNKKYILGITQLKLILNTIISYKDLPIIKFINFNFETIDFDDKETINLIFKLHETLDILYQKCKFKNYKFDYFNFQKTIAFGNCVFNDTILFKHCTFSEIFYFQNCEVKNGVNLSATKFEKNAYFNNTKFSDYADFHEAEFEAVACFYGAKFEKPMNFSSVIFKDFNKANFVNLNTEKIDINSIKNSIENYKKLETKIQWANNFRDSFRVIKHSLIETNNNLEASNFHKLELYAKEIELGYKIGKENPNLGNKIESDKTKFNKNNYAFQAQKVKKIIHKANNKIANFCKFSYNFALNIAPYYFIVGLVYFLMLPAFLIVFIKNILWFVFKSILPMNYKYFKAYWVYYAKLAHRFTKFKTRKMINFIPYVDWLLLKIYRNTSEHHTNFARILNFTICMIAIYGLLMWFIEDMVAQIQDFSHVNIIFTIVIIFIFCIIIKSNLSSISSIGLFLILSLIVATNFIRSMITSTGSLLIYKEVIVLGLLYILSIFLLYRLFIIKHNFIIFTIRAISYIIFLFMLYGCPNTILPFANLNSQEFKTKYLENNIAEANKTEIIELASIINPEFNATKNPNSSENLSISELNEYKKFIVENKEILKDSDATNAKFKQAIYADNSRDKTIKCISFIYAIILGLCLFSLQKTARRNSVVPS